MTSAGKANAVYYGAENSTDYVLDLHHRVRRDIARDLAASALRASPEPRLALEIGPGAHPLMTQRDLPPRTSYVTVDIVTTPREDRQIAANIESGIPVASGAVDVLVACEVVEHVFDVEEFLAECRRALKPDGYIVLTTPNLAALQDRLAFLLGRSPRHVSPLHPYLRFHIRPFTRSSLASTMSACGFGVKAIKSNFVIWRSSTRQFLRLRTAARVLPGLGGSLVVLAQRLESASGSA